MNLFNMFKKRNSTSLNEVAYTSLNLKQTQVATTNLSFYDSDIRNVLIENIRNAKHTIYVVSAWFTSDCLFQELLKKKKQNVEIVIIIDKNNINDEKNLPYSTAGTVYALQVIYPNSKHSNTMHNKYCIIDDSIVIDGSFNWTDKASYNLEHIIVIKDATIASIYKENFQKLRNSKFVI